MGAEYVSQAREIEIKYHARDLAALEDELYRRDVVLSPAFRVIRESWRRDPDIDAGQEPAGHCQAENRLDDLFQGVRVRSDTPT